MKCLSPITVSTRSKVLVPSFNEPLKRELRCGKCANCQQTLQREWYYRSFYEYKSTVDKKGYMLMDCLTYSDKHVPRMSRFYPDLPRKLDYMCFDYYDLRYFLVRLRDYLKKRGYIVSDTLRYFASAEYGTDDFKTHRPHIHILFYVTTPNLDNITLSKAISSCWHYGRTDGVIYKGKSYVENYTIRGGLVSSQRVCKYVSKYVMKSSAYQKVIDKRINELLYYYYDTKFKYYVHGDYSFENVDFYYRKPKAVTSWSSFESFLKSTAAKELKTNLARYMNQFHRQSIGFGASAMNDINIDDVISSNVISIPDGKSVVMRLGLPNYYRRKLFYDLVEVNGMKSWQLKNTLEARRYKQKRDEDKRKMLIEQFQLDKYEYHLQFDETALADYVLNTRYRHKDAIFDDELSLVEKLNTPDVFYNYSTRSDAKHFHGKFVTDVNLGNSQNNYIYQSKPTKEINVISFYDYIRMNMVEDRYFENILELIKEKKRLLNDSIQINYDNMQRLNQVYKNLQM